MVGLVGLLGLALVTWGLTRPVVPESVRTVLSAATPSLAAGSDLTRDELPALTRGPGGTPHRKHTPVAAPTASSAPASPAATGGHRPAGSSARAGSGDSTPSTRSGRRNHPGGPGSGGTATTAAQPPPAPSTPAPPPPAAQPSGDLCAAGALPPPLTAMPNADNTGVPASVGLHQVNGDLKTTGAGQVISGLDISGALVVTHDDVTVTCSRIRGGVINQARGLRLWATDIGDPSGNSVGAGIKSTSYTLRRVEIQGVIDGMRAEGDVDVRDTYVHDLYYTSDSGQASGMTHNDIVQMTQGAHMVFEHNTFAAWSFHQGQTAGANLWATPYGNGDGYCTSIVMISNQSATVSDVVFRDNLMRGRASKYVIVVGQVSGVSVVGNRMGRETRDYPQLFGIHAGSAVTVSGNVFYDDGSPANT